MDWRRVSWNAGLNAEFHVVILSPDVAESEYISKEILVSRTKKTVFIPILAPDYVGDEAMLKTIRASFQGNKNLSVLNEIHWFIPDSDYPDFIADLMTAINKMNVKHS